MNEKTFKYQEEKPILLAEASLKVLELFPEAFEKAIKRKDSAMVLALAESLKAIKGC